MLDSTPRDEPMKKWMACAPIVLALEALAVVVIMRPTPSLHTEEAMRMYGPTAAAAKRAQ